MEFYSWNHFKSVLKNRVPRYWLDMYAQYRYLRTKSAFDGKKIEEIFGEIFKNNYWKNTETISGPGSTLITTEGIRAELEKLCAQLVIRKMIDVPCGDFNWMQKINLHSIQYIGFDIVEQIIESNKKKYESEGIRFKRLDLTKDQLPTADLVFCRDCLVHFSYADIHKALANIKKSNCTYLMTTSFQTPVLNYDIHTGDWRPINLERPPFNFSPPMYTIKDEPVKSNLQYDLKKILGLWKISDL